MDDRGNPGTWHVGAWAVGVGETHTVLQVSTGESPLLGQGWRPETGLSGR